MQILSAVLASQFQRRFCCTGFSEVPCAFGRMTVSSQRMGYLDDCSAEAKGAFRKLKFRDCTDFDRKAKDMKMIRLESMSMRI